MKLIRSMLCLVFFAGFALPLFAADEGIKIGGALRFNIRYTMYAADDEYPQNFNFLFDTFRLDVKGKDSSGILFDAQYRLYAYQDFSVGDGSGIYHTLHHGWIGYTTGTTQFELGVTQVPFGNLTWASHNWYFVTPYYVGLEDDYDSGLKVTYKNKELRVDVAYFMQAEPGMGAVQNRYSYDITPKSSVNQSNEELNQFNLRAAYTIMGTELGASFQYGQIYNSALDEKDMDDRQSAIAWAAHVNGTYGPINVKLQYTYYNYDADDDDGKDLKKVNMSAYALDYFVAAQAEMYTAGISYDLKVNAGPISKLIFYNDYTYTKKINAAFDDTHQNTLGFVIAAGGVWTYVDFTLAKNHPWVSGADGMWTDGLAEGDRDREEWESNININLAYYF